MLNNYADSGGGFNSNHGQPARATEAQKQQQNPGSSWGYNGQLEGMYYGGEHQPVYMGPYDGSSKHSSYPQYPTGTIHQPVPTSVVQCQKACCQHYDNRYPINPAPLRYQPSSSVQPGYTDITNDSRQYFADRRPVQANLPRKKVYPSENGYAGIAERHYSQYIGRGQPLPVDSRQQMQMMRPQYPVYSPYWGSSRGWGGARMNCPPPSYHQSVNQGSQQQPGSKMPDSSQFMDPSLQKSLSAQHHRGIGSNNGKLDIIRPVPEPKRPTLDPSLQSCYEYSYPTGFVPFNEVNKMQGKSLNPQSNSVPCKVPPDKQYHPHQMQYSYQNNDRNLINYVNPTTGPGYSMNYPLPGSEHVRPDIEDGQQVSDARKLSMHYDSSSGKKRQDLDVRQFLATWEDDEDESARLSEPPISVGTSATPYIVVDCRTIESEAAAKLQERFKPPTQDCVTKPRVISPSSEHKRTNELTRQEESAERTILHSDPHSQTNYAPSMPTLLSDSEKSVNFWNGTNKEGDNIIGKGGAFQPLDCSKRDSNVDPKAVTQRELVPPKDLPTHKVLCSNDPSSSFDALVSFYGDNRRISGGYDLVEMSERLVNSSDKTQSDHPLSSEVARPNDPRLQQSQYGNNPSIYNKISPRYPTNSYQHFKGVSSDPYYNNYKHPITSGGKYYGYENLPFVDSNYDYNKFVSEFDNSRLYGSKEIPKDPRRVLYPESQKTLDSSFLEPLQKAPMLNLDKANLEYTSMEPEQFMSPIIVKATNSQGEPCSEKTSAISDISNVANNDSENQIQTEKTVLVASQNDPPEVFRVPYSPEKETAHKDNVVTLHSGDQSKSNTITVEVPYVQQYSNLVKLSEEICRTENVGEKESETNELSQEGHYSSSEDTKKPTSFKLKRLPNSKEWTVEGNESTESSRKEIVTSSESSDINEDSDILKTSVSVSNLNMPSLDDIRDGDENCEVVIENHSKTKVSDGVLCSSKSASISDEITKSKYTSQPPQLAIVQPMKLIQCESKLSEQNLHNELNNEEGKTKQALKVFRSFHHQNSNRTTFSSDKSVSLADCGTHIDGIKSDISKHENFRSHKKIQGDFSNTYPSCLSSPNDSFTLSQDGNSEPSKRQYSSFHMYSDCEVNSQLPDFFKIDQRAPLNEKILDSQIPTSPGVEAMFEDINHSNNQLCHNQIYQRKSCNFQDLTSASLSTFDNHNSHFQSFSNIFAEDSNNKGRCDGSVLHMGDKKYLKSVLDDIERQQVSKTLEERVSKLKSNFMNETSNNETCEAKKSPIPPINLKLNESKKVWCITNKDKHLSLSDLPENISLDLATNSSNPEKETSLLETVNGQEKYFVETSGDETNKSCYESHKSFFLPQDTDSSKTVSNDETEREPNFNHLLSTKSENERPSSQQNSFLADSGLAVLKPLAKDDDIANESSVSAGSAFSSVANCNETTTLGASWPQSKSENSCLSLVKYYPRNEIIKSHMSCRIEDILTQNIFIFDENGKHFPDEHDKDRQSRSIAKYILNSIIKHVVHSKEIVENQVDNAALASLTQNNSSDINKPGKFYFEMENTESVIRFDKSTSLLKSVKDKKCGVTVTTEIFIQREKEHNQHLSVIKAIPSEKNCSLVESKSSFIQSIFSPMLEENKDNDPLSLLTSCLVTKSQAEEGNVDSTEFESSACKMDIDVTENQEENQPIDYSFSETLIAKNTLSSNGFASERAILCNDSEDKKCFKELNRMNCHSNENTSSNNNIDKITDNSFQLASIELITKSSCLNNQSMETDCLLDSETIPVTEKSTSNLETSKINSNTSFLEENLDSDQMNLEEDFYISDREAADENKTSAQETSCHVEVNVLSGEIGPSSTVNSEELSTCCTSKDLESSDVTRNKMHETEDQRYDLEVIDQSSNESPIAPTRSVDNFSNDSVKQSSEPTNQEDKLTTKESFLVNYCLKNVNFQNPETEIPLPKKENCELESILPNNDCPLKASDDKLGDLSRANSNHSSHTVAGFTKIHTEERLETSVIVRNNTFTNIINNQLQEPMTLLHDKPINVESDYLISKLIPTNKQIPEDLSLKNLENSESFHSKEQVLEDKPSGSFDKNQYFFNQISKKNKVYDHANSLSNGNSNKDTKEDRVMEVEPTDLTQALDFRTPEFKPGNTALTPLMDEKDSNNNKPCYCVSESVFLNIEKEFLVCLEKSCSSYLFDFKQRKLLKFKSITKNGKSNKRDFSIINFGLNTCQQHCSSTVPPRFLFPEVICSQSENIKRTQESVQKVNLNSINVLSDQCQDTTVHSKNSFIGLQSTPTPQYKNNNKEEISSDFKNDQTEGDLEVKAFRFIGPLKSKSNQLLAQEINSFCIKRDSLKLFEPEAVLKEIFSPDPENQEPEGKENLFSASFPKERCNSLNKPEKLGFVPTPSADLASQVESNVENKWNGITSASQSISAVNCDVSSLSNQDESVTSTNFDLCISYVNSEKELTSLSKPTAKIGKLIPGLDPSNTSHSLRHKILEENGAATNTLNKNSPIEDPQSFMITSLDYNNHDISNQSINKDDKAAELQEGFTGHFSDLIESNQPSFTSPSKIVDSCDQITSKETMLSNKDKYTKESPNHSKLKCIEESFLSHENHRASESLNETSVSQDLPVLPCHIPNLSSHRSHTTDSGKSISSLNIVTGRDVLFSSRILEDEEDKESSSELQTGSRSRKSSVEEESVLDCQNLKINSQDSLRVSSNLNSETFPLQCLVEAALALENVDSKQMLLNSSSFSGMYSQSSQNLIKSTIGDVHPNDLEDFPEKQAFPNNSSEGNASEENNTSSVDREISSKFEENNYNLRASTRIVTSSSSNIIPYSKRYYGLKRQKLPKPPTEKKKKSDSVIERNRTKKRKDVFTYPRSKRRKKGVREKSKCQKLKLAQHFHENSSESNCIQSTSSVDMTQNYDIDLFVDRESANDGKAKHVESISSFNEKPLDMFDPSPHPSSSDFGGPLIIARDNSPVDSNIFCVHVNSEKVDDYVHDLNVGGLELLSDNNQSVFKENPIEESSCTPDVTLENGTSLVIIIEELGENGDKDNYFNTCKGDSDVILGCIEERSPLPQPNAILDYSSDNLTNDVLISESCICPSNLENESSGEHSLFQDNKIVENEGIISNPSYDISGSNVKSYEKYSLDSNQELLTTNCYEEINETLVNDIGNWPFVEEEVAEFDIKSVSPNRIPEEGRKIELKCSLPWNKIFNMSKTKKKKNKTSNKVSGLELGPAKVEVRLRAPSTEWKVISDYAESSSPVVKVSRLILQRESETSSYSEKDSEEENEIKKLLSPSSTNSELKYNSDSNEFSLGNSLIEDESWQPVVLLTRDKELDELTLARTRDQDSDEEAKSKTRDKELTKPTPISDLPFDSRQLTFDYSSSSNTNRHDLDKDHLENGSSKTIGGQIGDDSLSSNQTELYELYEDSPNNFENVGKDLSSSFSGVDAFVKYQNPKPEKGPSYETYSPSRHNSSLADEIIYSPSDPHYSPEPCYPCSSSSPFEDKRKSVEVNESSKSPMEHQDDSLNPTNFGDFRNKSPTYMGTPDDNVNSLPDYETCDTYGSSETQTSSSFYVSRNYFEGISTNPSAIGKKDPMYSQLNNKNVCPDLLNAPNIITNEETRKAGLTQSIAEENFKTFKRKMPKNFFVRRKSRKNLHQHNSVNEKLLLTEKLDLPSAIVSSTLLGDNSSVELKQRQKISSNSLTIENLQNVLETEQNSASSEEQVRNSESGLLFDFRNSRLQSVDNLEASSPMRLNESPLSEKFEEKLRLRDGGRGLKRPGEGHSKEDTKRRRKNHRSHSNRCEECDTQFQSKEELSQHAVQHESATRELHHCLLCQRSFSSATRHRLHEQGRSHRHLELMQRHTIHSVHRLLAGGDCPHLPSLNRAELRALSWRPVQPGCSHVYHQFTPLQTLLQEYNSEASEEMLLDERRQEEDAKRLNFSKCSSSV